MSTEIELLCSPIVKHVQARVTGVDDDRLVYADIKFNVSVPHTDIEQFLEGSSHLWVTDLAGKTVPRFPGINAFSLKRKWENIDLKLAPDLSFIEDAVDSAIKGFEGGRIHRISFDPSIDMAMLSFTYTAQMPGMEIGQLIDRVLNQQVGIHLYSAQKELF